LYTRRETAIQDSLASPVTLWFRNLAGKMGDQGNTESPKHPNT
jgi:hypothetical protein